MKAPRKKMTKENWTGIAFITPALVLLFVFLFIPFFMTVGYSFTNYNILKPDRMETTTRDNTVGAKNASLYTEIPFILRLIIRASPSARQT